MFALKPAQGSTTDGEPLLLHKEIGADVCEVETTAPPPALEWERLPTFSFSAAKSVLLSTQSFNHNKVTVRCPEAAFPSAALSTSRWVHVSSCPSSVYLAIPPASAHQLK